ncbi:DUF1365 domain-containing protein [Hoeflea prorocentri]|uniref:DUF1365 domain-containing protein n=1 Tax=Hoeflea prorocentri TaxID=1922333 RepID=A0A9X3UKB0_9HYPH|nr:DUF1365 domain-containing protein [Hoeflea prorocentri]MCY6382224.1 DUF1365 domain-containing protein [Hoeflea prorocentri]MDA5400024.1 DUF1365 domain-containing protein [Hoeflea prorocentri]
MSETEAIYAGTVMHRRLRPKPHAFKYSVFSILIDIDRLEQLGKRLRLFSHNRFNLYSVHDRDHGNGDGLKPHLTHVACEALGTDAAQRFLMLCYPRVLGYVFNPLTVYYGIDEQGRTVVMIYEVSNTFGERHTYAIPVDNADDHVMRQSCEKVFHVSPFNEVRGRYAFKTRMPGKRANVAILLHDEDGPLLAAQFSGERRPLSDRTLVKMFIRHGAMTLKVWAGIHYEALKLWGKGLPLFKKPSPPETPVTVPPRRHNHKRLAA